MFERESGGLSRKESTVFQEREREREDIGKQAENWRRGRMERKGRVEEFKEKGGDKKSPVKL